MSNLPKRIENGVVVSDEGWFVRLLGPDLIEYSSGPAICLVNVGYVASKRARQVYATESSSDLFPDLREHLQSALPLLQGHYIVV